MDSREATAHGNPEAKDTTTHTLLAQCLQAHRLGRNTTKQGDLPQSRGVKEFTRIRAHSW